MEEIIVCAFPTVVDKGVKHSWDDDTQVLEGKECQFFIAQDWHVTTHSCGEQVHEDKGDEEHNVDSSLFLETKVQGCCEERREQT
jgi:hypothetical protein